MHDVWLALAVAHGRVSLLSFLGLPLGLVWIAIPTWLAREGVDIRIIVCSRSPRHRGVSNSVVAADGPLRPALRLGANSAGHCCGKSRC